VRVQAVGTPVLSGFGSGAENTRAP